MPIICDRSLVFSTTIYTATKPLIKYKRCMKYKRGKTICAWERMKKQIANNNNLFKLLMLIVNKTTCRSFPYVYHWIINMILAEKQKLYIFHFVSLSLSPPSFGSLFRCFVSLTLQIMFPFHPYFMVLLLNYALKRSKFKPKNHMNQRRKTIECSRHKHTHMHTGEQ